MTDEQGLRRTSDITVRVSHEMSSLFVSDLWKIPQEISFIHTLVSTVENSCLQNYTFFSIDRDVKHVCVSWRLAVPRNHVTLATKRLT